MSHSMSRGAADSHRKPLEINGSRLQHERDMRAGSLEARRAPNA